MSLDSPIIHNLSASSTDSNGICSVGTVNLRHRRSEASLNDFVYCLGLGCIRTHQTSDYWRHRRFRLDAGDFPSQGLKIQPKKLQKPGTMPLDRKQDSSTGLSYFQNSPTTTPERHVLCIPGSNGFGSDYLPMLEVLANTSSSFLYIAPDLPGLGDFSSVQMPNPTFSDMAGLLRRLCTAVGFASRNVILIGHSMGCRLALEVFSQSPDAISDIILIEGNWRGKEPPINVQELPPRDIQLQYILKGLEPTFGPGTPDAFKEKHRRMFNDADLDYVTQVVIANRRWDAERMVEVLQQLQGVSRDGHLVRLLLVQSMDTESKPPRSLSRGEETMWMKLAREHTGGAYSSLIVEDAGHWPHVEKPDEVAESVLAFIRRASESLE